MWAARTGPPFKSLSVSAAATCTTSCDSPACNRATACSIARRRTRLLPLCGDQHLGVLPYNPLAGGLLTAKYARDEPPPADTRFGLSPVYRDLYWNDREFQIVEAIADLAREIGVSITTLSVAWVLSQASVTSAIVGASHKDQLAETMTGSIFVARCRSPHSTRSDHRAIQLIRHVTANDAAISRHDARRFSEERVSRLGEGVDDVPIVWDRPGRLELQEFEPMSIRVVHHRHRHAVLL